MSTGTVIKTHTCLSPGSCACCPDVCQLKDLLDGAEAEAASGGEAAAALSGDAEPVAGQVEQLQVSEEVGPSFWQSLLAVVTSSLYPQGLQVATHMNALGGGFAGAKRQWCLQCHQHHGCARQHLISQQTMLSMHVSAVRSCLHVCESGRHWH